MTFKDLEIGNRFIAVGSNIICEKISDSPFALDNCRWVGNVTPEKLKFYGKHHYVDADREVRKL